MGGFYGDFNNQLSALSLLCPVCIPLHKEDFSVKKNQLEDEIPGNT